MSAAINVHATNLAPSEDKAQNGHSTQEHHEEHEHPPHPDDDKSPEEIRQAYEELRIEVEPAEAMIDPNVQFEHPETFPANDVGHDVLHNVARHNKRTLASFSMTNKVCVVTGAARGLGNMMARTMIESGSTQMVILDLRQEECDKAVEDIKDWFKEEVLTPEERKKGLASELECYGVACDVSDEASVQAAFDIVKAKFGRCDALITAAGIVENFIAEEYPTDKVKKLMDINVMGTWYCALKAKELMEDGGSMIFIGSMSGSIVNIPQPQTPYNFSKAAVRHMARSLAVEWALKKIRVNCISPGYMLTNLTKVILDNDPVLRDTWISKIPVGRMGDPSDLKGAIIYLASDASKYTTGSEMVIDGGYTCV